jgi:hypothetical protein
MTHLISGNTIFVTVNGKPFSITSDHPQFITIRDAILAKLSEDVIEGLFDQAAAISKFMAGKVSKSGGSLYYKGEPVRGLVADRILSFMAKGVPHEPIVRFLERLLVNPSKRAVEELYCFMEANKMPITEDGFVLGYKGVDCDWRDGYTHTIDNKIGASITRLERNQVDDNWRVECSNGYHVGSLKYAKEFAGSRGHVVIVKVDPADVISVPEKDCWKMRVCYYEVVAESQGELPPFVAVSRAPYAEPNFVMRVLRKLFGTNSNQKGTGVATPHNNA